MTYSFFFLTVLLPAVFSLITIVASPKGVWETARRLSKSPQDQQAVDRQKAAIIEEETTKIRSRFNGEAEQWHSYEKEKIFKAIDYSIGRHDWYEAQRASCFSSILAIVGIGFTAAGILLQANIELSELAQSAVFGIVIINIVSVVYAVYLYNGELDQDRPYRLISDIRHWYFRYNLPDSSNYIWSGRNQSERARRVIEERTRFLDRILELQKPEELIREDFEQIFILQILQRYKHESLKRIRWLLSYLVIFVSIEISFAFLG